MFCRYLDVVTAPLAAGFEARATALKTALEDNIQFLVSLSQTKKSKQSSAPSTLVVWE